MGGSIDPLCRTPPLATTREDSDAVFPWWWVLISLLLALGVLLSLWRGRRTEALHAQQLAEFEDRSSRSVPGSLLNPACSGTEETAPRRSPMLTPSCRSARGDGDLTADIIQK